MSSELIDETYKFHPVGHFILYDKYNRTKTLLHYTDSLQRLKYFIIRINKEMY
jgi:hypothetical protein